MSFSNMTPERRREIALMGQAALKASGRRRTFTPQEAVAAAKKGAEMRKQKAALANAGTGASA